MGRMFRSSAGNLTARARCVPFEDLFAATEEPPHEGVYIESMLKRLVLGIAGAVLIAGAFGAGF